MLDHVGKRSIASGELAYRGRQLLLSAAHPHVVCKVSELITEADHAGWTTPDIRHGGRTARRSAHETWAILAGTATTFYSLPATPENWR